MSIYLNQDSRIIVQGMTGGMGSKHTTLMLDAGSTIVGGVNARKAGTTVELGGQELPVFGNVKEAMAETGADVSVVFVTPTTTPHHDLIILLSSSLYAPKNAAQHYAPCLDLSRKSISEMKNSLNDLRVLWRPLRVSDANIYLHACPRFASVTGLEVPYAQDVILS